MGIGGEVSGRSNARKRVRSKDKGSDDSDEDYVVSEEENEDDLEYCSSLDGCASEEVSLGNFVVEDEEEEKEVEKVGWQNVSRSSFSGEEASDKTSRKRRRMPCGKEDDEDYEGEEAEEEDDEEELDFVVDEDDCYDEEGELTLTRKNSLKASKRRLQNRGLKNGKKYAVSNQPERKEGQNKRRLKRKSRASDDNDDGYEDDDNGGDFTGSNPGIRKDIKTSLARRKRRFQLSSDSEEEGEGEAQKLCENVKPALRNSSSLEKIENSENLGQCRKPLIRKGKEKVEELKIELAKQVCGICLSEEDKRRVRGTLDSCSHYFCFACIMEWSKVESRCPLCKQRFKTISKPARSVAGVDLREVVMQVPERDQVYQPSEEELMGFLNPYENVICSVCLHGGDDSLMLLCDICDSSSHTYCVGLGREVPEGNWYCDNCKPVALASSTPQVRYPFSEQRTNSNNVYNRPSPLVNLGGSVEPAFISSPHAPFAHIPATPLPFGAGASTISERRWILRHIQGLISRDRMNYMDTRRDTMAPANTSNDLLNSQVHHLREALSLAQQPRMQETGTLYSIVEESSRVRPAPLPSLQSRNILPQVAQGPSTATMNLTLWPQHAGISQIPSNIAFNGSYYSESSIAKEQLQSMVITHLQSLSRDINLGNSFQDIASRSTQTILAACGLEHIRSEVHFVPQPSLCTHVERLLAGERSLLKGCCFVCFDSFVKDVVKRIVDTTSLPSWLSLGL